MGQHMITTLAEQDELTLAPGFFEAVGRGVGAILLYALVGLALMIIGFYAIDVTTPGRLGHMVREGAPNAVVVTAMGLVSMALIVVVAIYSTSDRMLEGLLTSMIFGLAGIAVQVLAVRLLERIIGIDIGLVLQADRFSPVSLIVGAGHFALGLVVAVAVS